MPDQRIFCNVPWTNVHVYQDGSLGICCKEKEKLYQVAQGNIFHLSQMTLQEWYNSAPVTTFREQISGNNKLKQCESCYYAEAHRFVSKRFQENQKTIIFTDAQNFKKSYNQSTGLRAFKYSQLNNGLTDVTPIDWHIDLGNECNLACKMCRPTESSKVGAIYKKWNLLPKEKSIFTDWTENTSAWNNFLKSLDNQTNLNRLHFMGGEPLISKKFHQIIDRLILLERSQNISLSFVTNGTLINQSIINKLKKFKSCDLEFSLESFEITNNYIRHGTEIKDLLQKLNLVLSNQTENFQLVLRAVPQLLSINTYDSYIRWAWKNKIPIQSTPLMQPAYLQIQNLPAPIKQKLKIKFQELLNEITSTSSKVTLLTSRDRHRNEHSLLSEISGIISMLDQIDPPDVENQRKQLVSWLLQWDREFNFNALELYPEYKDFLISYGYKI